MSNGTIKSLVTGEDQPKQDMEGSRSHVMFAAEEETIQLSERPSSVLTRSLTQPDENSINQPERSYPRALSEVHRRAHIETLISQRKKSMRYLFNSIAEETAVSHGDGGSQLGDIEATEDRKKILEGHSTFVKKLKAHLEKGGNTDSFKVLPVEIRLQNVSYKVPMSNDSPGSQIKTIYNTSPLYKLQKLIHWVKAPKAEAIEKKYLVTDVLSNVNLVLKPQKMYLVLGPPLSGKTSLLKAIAGMLPQGEFPSGFTQRKFFTGQVYYNNLVCLGEGTCKSNRTLFKNLVAFVRQNDSHAPRFTVNETFTFSERCKDPKNRDHFKEGSSPVDKVGLVLDALGLSHVKDTYVGNEEVRGVSGGQRRRVTLGEMLVFDTPVLCGDEISTGLDTMSTIDILSILSFSSRLLHRVTVVSLLQPSPEAVSLFDEIILLGSGGHVIFTGPTENAKNYFRNLGYVQPDSMDDADYLLAVASTHRQQLYKPDDLVEEGSLIKLPSHSTESLGVKFHMSSHSSKIKEFQQMSWKQDWNDKDQSFNLASFQKKYQNSFITSVLLNLKRSFILWTRDRIFIRASVIKNIAMGLSVGAVFFNTDVNSSFFGVLFQGNLFIMLGAMTTAPEKVGDRVIFYKHDDANFYPALSYIIGQALALVPQMILDVLLFGSLVYWMVGFSATAGGFFLYVALFFSFNFTMGQLFGLLASIAPSKNVVQAGGAVILLLNTLFCGYIVSPTVIPAYYIWIYWMMPLSWVYRALLLNEFTSADYPNGEGELILQSYGFLYKGEPFTREWIGYCFAFLLPFLSLCMVLSAISLQFFRRSKQKGQPDMPGSNEMANEEISDSRHDAAFVPVNLTFNNISYDVKSSVGQDSIRLLNNVSGMFSEGRMCALMGESGAGKTTLMDVISLRKRSGTITGEVLLNGFPQEEISFRRCSGYVEQFDIQSAELTVIETIRFSALLRLDRSNPIFDTPDGLNNHIDYIIRILELTNEADILVGNEEEGGLTFEQKKRLSIAVELAASPSIVFLDEPTSGLDARAALLVMNALRKICNSGRTIVATIHQPSSTVFEMFDDLLLLKKGGEVVFFGSLGSCSCNLIRYFEDLGAFPMDKGENPATWMLNVLRKNIMKEGESDKEKPLDLAQAWMKSNNYNDLQRCLHEIKDKKDINLKIKYKTEFAAKKREMDNLMANRLVTIYWRSPAYNLSRMGLSAFIAFLLGSVFIPIRANTVFTEAQMTSILATIFISFIIIGVLSITTVFPVMLSIRDMYYRHKAAGMIGSSSVARALATAEKRFILISGFLFCIVFIPISGIGKTPEGSDIERNLGESFAFWGYFTFNMAIYSYIGELFMCLVRGPGTAQVLASIFIGINNFFSGLIVRPQQMTGLWAFTYWINPGHYVYEGLVMSFFSDDSRQVVVSVGSDYYNDLNCENISVDGECQVTVTEYVNAFFGGKFSKTHDLRNALILGGILFLVRASTYVALNKLTYSGK